MLFLLKRDILNKYTNENLFEIDERFQKYYIAIIHNYSKKNQLICLARDYV